MMMPQRVIWPRLRPAPAAPPHLNKHHHRWLLPFGAGLAIGRPTAEQSVFSKSN